MPGRGPACVLGAGAVALALVCAAVPAVAQERLVVPSPVLTVDQDALFQRSAFGQRTESELEADVAALAAENRRIEAELAEEERQLTEARATMDPTDFRDRAAAFDAKVVEIRRTQDQKGRDLQRRPDEARQEFFRAAYPILAEIVRERGAVAILDDRAVILSADAIDVTEEAIRRVDAALGDGTARGGAEDSGESSPGQAIEEPLQEEGGPEAEAMPPAAGEDTGAPAAAP